MIKKFWRENGFNVIDYIVLIFFLVVLLALPFIIGFSKRRLGLLALTFAGRNLNFLTMAFSMFLSENGFALMTGISGWAVQSGLGIYADSLVGTFGLLALGWIFMPIYMASGSLTTIDYAKKRFGGKRIEIVMATLMLIINLFSKIAVELYSANVMLRRLYDVPYGIIYAGLLFGSVILVSTGGLFSIVYTSIWQFLFFLVGMPVVFLFSYWSHFSWEEIVVKYKRSWPETTIKHVTNSSSYEYAKCGIPDVQSLDLIRSYNDPVLPWPGMIFGIFIISIYNFCIDQSILQFCLCGKTIIHVKCACIVSGYFKVLSIFMIIPGFIARVLFTDTVACADPEVCEKICGKRAGCDDLALPLIFQKVIPPGWRGLVLSAFLAASLTSIAATLHAGSTIFTFNLYRPLRPRAKERELTMAGKLVILVQGLIGLLLVLLVDRLPLIHVFIKHVYACLVPPLVAVYIIAIFWSHVTEEIAFHTLFLGSCFSFIRLIWQLVYGMAPCGDEAKIPIPDIIDNFHYLHFATFLFVVCASFVIINGMTTDPIMPLHMYRLIYWLRHSRLDRVDINEMKSRLDSTPETNVSALKSPSTTSRNSTELSVVQTEKDESQDAKNAVEKTVEKAAEKTANDERGQCGEFQQEVDADREGCLGKCGALSNRKITDDLLREAMQEKTSVLELPHQTNTLNMALVLLLLVITFLMAFFT